MQVKERTDREPIVLIASSEFILKSAPVRHTLEQRLIDDLKSALKKAGYEGFRIRKHAARFVVEGIQNSDETAATCARVFGVAYAAPGISVPAESSLIVSAILDLAKESIESGQSFAIRCHRSTPTTLSRREIEIQGGNEVLKALSGRGVQVDLGEPDVTISADLADDRAYLYTSKVLGPSGLPVSAQWRMLSVLDSGLLTILAAYAMMRRGCLVELLIPISSTDPRYEPTRQYAAARKLKALVPKQSYRAYTVSADLLEKNSDQASISLMRAVAIRFAEKKHYRGVVFPATAGDIAEDPQVHGIPAFHPLIGLDVNDLLELCNEARLSREELLSELSQDSERAQRLDLVELNGAELPPIERIEL